MAPEVQTYKNHARFLPPFHFFVIPVLLVNVLVAIRTLWVAPGWGTAWALVVAMALLTLGFLARIMALTVQDRVIRLEMRLRLHECLPQDLRSRIDDLTPRQLIALRFASDAELADLVREVLAGKLGTSKEIKTRVKNWQGDWLRA
jgi:Family of unknown function (DUF6526)